MSFAPALALREITGESESIPSPALHLVETAAEVTGASDGAEKARATILSEIVESIFRIEREYCAAVNDATKTLTAQIQDAIQSGISANSPKSIQSRMTKAKSEFDDNLRAATGRWAAQLQMVQAEIQSLETRWNLKAVMSEIAETETTVERDGANLERMIRDASVELSKVMRANMQHNEMKAYLRGLRFASGLDH